MDKQYIKMISAFEQAGACLGQFASVMWQYYSHLCDQGFTKPEALVLVRAYQNTIIKQSLMRPPEPEQE